MIFFLCCILQMANTTVPAYSNGTINTPLASESASAVERIYSTWAGVTTGVGFMSASLAIVGIAVVVMRISQATRRRIMAHSTNASPEQMKLHYAFEKRQLALMIDLFIKGIASIVLVIVQWDRASPIMTLWLTSTQRIRLGYLLLALSSASSVRLWTYRHHLVEHSSLSSSSLAVLFGRFALVASIVAVAWDAVDLATQILNDQPCTWFCQEWLVWSINFISVILAIGGWIHVISQLEKARRAEASIRISSSLNNHEFPTLIAIGTGSIFSIVAMVACYSVLVASFWVPARASKTDALQSTDRSDELWVTFTTTYLLYMSGEMFMSMSGELDRPPITTHFGGSNSTLSGHSGLTMAAAAALEKTLDSISDRSNAHPSDVNPRFEPTADSTNNGADPDTLTALDAIVSASTTPSRLAPPPSHHP
jgi:hypothetical protein